MDAKLYTSNLQRTYDLDECSYVLISKEQYNGYEKALRIIRDRALQQIDKAVADEIGYVFLSAEAKYMRQEKIDNLMYVRYRTAYSIKIPLANIKGVIIRDLIERHNMMPESMKGYSYTNWNGEKVYESISDRNIWNGVRDFITDKYNGNDWKYREYKDNPIDIGYRKVYDYIQSKGGAIAVEIDKIIANVGQGVYEVSFWATDVV